MQETVRGIIDIYCLRGPSEMFLWVQDSSSAHKTPLPQKLPLLTSALSQGDLSSLQHLAANKR